MQLGQLEKIKIKNRLSIVNVINYWSYPSRDAAEVLSFVVFKFSHLVQKVRLKIVMNSSGLAIYKS